MNLVIARSVVTKQSSEVAVDLKHRIAKALDCFATLAMTIHQLAPWAHEERSEEI